MSDRPTTATNVGSESKLPPLQPQAASSDWFVAGVDGNTYGPYTITDLIEAAQEGRIVESTFLCHYVASSNQWVPAVQFPQIASRFAVKHQPVQSPPVVVRTRRRVSSNGSRFKIIRDVAMSLIPVAMVYFAYTRVIAPHVQQMQVSQSLQGNSPSAARDAEVIAPRQKAVLDTRSNADFRAPLEPSERKPALSGESAAYSNPNAFKSMAPLVNVNAKPKKPQPSQLVSLSLSEGKQIEELSTLPVGERYRLSAIVGVDGSTSIEPPTGLIEQTQTVKAYLYRDQSVFVSVKSIGRPNEPLKISIDYQTKLDWLGGGDLSESRLNRKRITLMRQLASLNQQYSVATGEINSLTTYIKSKGLKTLGSVHAAQNRIAALTPVATSLQTQIINQESTIVRFDDSCRELSSFISSAKLKFEVIDDDDQATESE